MLVIREDRRFVGNDKFRRKIISCVARRAVGLEAALPKALMNKIERVPGLEAHIERLMADMERAARERAGLGLQQEDENDG